MKKAAIYIRVSTLEQAEHGFSVDEQKERLLAYCKAMNYEVAGIFVDPGYSGSNLERPAIQKLIAEIRLFDVVIIYKLDRLSRSQKDTLQIIEDALIKNKVDIVSLQENLDTSTPFGRAAIGILSAFAQLERENFKERSILGRTGRARKGMWVGTSRPPIGYDYDVERQQLIVNPYESEQVRMVFNQFLAGIGVQKIAQILHTSGYTHKYGNWIHWGGITNMLKNTVYIGNVTFNDQEFNGSHEPIVDKDLFTRVQDMLANRGDREIFKKKYPFTHLLRCAYCDAKFLRQPKKDRHGNPTPKYYCYSRYGKPLSFVKDRTCKAKIWNVDLIDNEILGRIESIASDKKLVQKYLAPPKKKDLNRTHLEKRIADIDKQTSKLLDLYQFNTIPIDEINSRVQVLQNEKNGIKAMLESRQNKTATPTMTVAEIQGTAHSIIDNWNTMDLNTKIERLNKLIKKIVVSDTGLDIYWTFCHVVGE